VTRRDHGVGRITATGEVSVHRSRTAESGPYGIATGPDGAVWFTETNAGAVGSPAAVPGAFPAHLAAGPDDALLFAAHAANAVGRVSAAGGVTRHQRPGEGSAPVGLPAGGDGALWFTEIGGGRIGRIATTGDVEEIALPDPAARPHAIAAAPGRCALGHRVGA